MKPIRWLIDRHPDFPASRTIEAYLTSHRQLEPIILNRRDILFGNWPETTDWIVGYGTMYTMSNLLRRSPLNIGVFDEYPTLHCSKYYAYIHPLLKRAFLFAPFGALPYLPLQKMFGDKLFVRSDTNYKLFPAEVLDISDLSKWVETYREHKNELAVVSEVVEFDIEYRCFCRNGVFFCGSSYPDEPYSEAPREVQKFAERAAQALADTGMNMLTIDVGLCGSELHIVEAGGVNSWGIYGANVDAFVTTMEAEARQRWEDFI